VLIRYCDDQFDSESSTATIGVDFKVYSAYFPRLPVCPILTFTQLKKLSVHGKAYRLNLLDTAGQERFRTLSNSYYRGAHGVILVYDISNRESFLAMERWFEEAETNAIPGAVMYLVGSKMDKKAARMVKYEDGERLAQAHGAGFCEVSSKTRENVRKPFVEIVDSIVGKPELLAATRRGGSTLAVGGAGQGYGSGCSC
jgi:Ras-related protein Rab-18